MQEEMEIEDTLDRDFLLFMSLTKTYFPQIIDQKNATLCTQWLSKLCSEKVQGISQKRNRNVFLSHLVMNMQEGKMTGPFSKPPGDGSLPAAKLVFGSAQFDETLTLDEDRMTDDIVDDFQERSADGRTYVATRCLPNNQGMFAFVALNIDKENEDVEGVAVAPCSIDKSKLCHIKALHKLTSDIALNEYPTESQMEDFYLRNIEAKTAGNVSQTYSEELCAPRGKPCGRNKNEIAFYDTLLKQIDEEIKGLPSSKNDLVRFLVNRLTQDLRKVPKMKHIFKLSPEQQNLKILEILRQKLVIRQQEEKRRNLLVEMEDCMMATSTHSDCCIDHVNDSAESMWKLAVTRPLTNNDIERLYNTYPQEAIATFLNLLADDRQVILMRGRKRQNKLIESMRSEVYKEVQSGKAEYNRARAMYREWNDILSLVEEMMYEGSSEVIEDVPHQKEQLLTNMITDIKKTENLVVEEAQYGEVLTEKIVDANVWKFSTQDDDEKDISWKIKSTIENLRKDVESYKLLIKNQEYRIQQLRDRL